MPAGMARGSSFHARAVQMSFEREVTVKCQLSSVGQVWVCGWEY